MFRFENPEYLYLLLALPLLAGLFLLVMRHYKQVRRHLCDARLFREQVPDYSWKRSITKFVLLMSVLFFIIVMLARPQLGLVEEKDSTQGIEVAFIVDVSNSMLARDVSPNRLDRSKLLVSALTDRMKNDKIALGVFAGEAYPQLPITNDYVSAKLFLDNFTPGMVTLQGTSLAKAINLGRISFTDKKDVGKAIVVITDGEDHAEGAIEAAKAAKEEGLKVYVLGAGTPQGTKIQWPDGTFLRDRDNQEVVTALNEDMCREVAKAGGGAYFRIDNSDAAQQGLQAEFSQLKKAGNVSNFSSYDEQFQAVALLALTLLIVEIFVLERKNPLFKRLRLFGR